MDVSGAALVEVARVGAHRAPTTHVRFSPDGAWLATGAGDAICLLWDPVSLAVARVVDRAESAIRGFSFTAAGAHIAIASGDLDDAARALDVVRVADGTKIAGVAVSPQAAAVGVGQNQNTTTAATQPLTRAVSWALHADWLAVAVDDLGPRTADDPPRSAAVLPGGAAYEAGAVKVLFAVRRGQR